MIGRHSPWPLAIIGIVALTAQVEAASKVTIQADRKEAQVGQPVLVTVRVRGAKDTPTVKPPTVKEAQIDPVGQPTSIPTLVADLQGQGVFHANGAQHIANLVRGLGQMPNAGAIDPDLAKLLGAQMGAAGLNTNDYFFTYQVTPDRSGPLVVPAFSVTADGQSSLTPTVTVNVSEARQQSWVQMRLSVSDPTPNVGEEVQLYVDLLIQRGQVSYAGKPYAYLPVSKVWLNVPGLDRARGVEMQQPLDQFVQQHAIEPGHHGFRVNNYPIEVKLEHEPADGPKVGLDPVLYRRRLTIPLRVRQGGEVKLAAAHAAGEVWVPAGQNKGQWEPFVVASEPLTFTAIDLHGRADRPADFSGVVGDLRVIAEASQTDMPAGTPFTLTVRLEGNSSVASVAAPDLASRPEFNKNFRVRLDDTRTVAGKGRQFTYTLRPLNADVTEVPSVAVSYFDPKRNQFATAQSGPIPLHVTPGQNATPDVPAAPPAQAAAPPTEATPEPGWTFDTLTWIEIGMAGALAVGAAAWGVRRLRRHRKVAAQPGSVQPAPLAVPVRPALVAPKRLPSAPAPTFASVAQSLQDFLRRHFHCPPGEVTPHDAEECLRRGGVSEGLARSFAAALDTCETAKFAPGMVNTSPSDLANYARQLMDRIMAGLPEVVV